MAMNYTHTFDKSFGISSKLAFGSAVPLETLIEERIFGSPEKKKFFIVASGLALTKSASPRMSTITNRRLSL